MWLQHEVDNADALPVLCKAIRWIAQYLPADAKLYKSVAAPTPGMEVNFPYDQV